MTTTTMTTTTATTTPTPTTQPKQQQQEVNNNKTRINRIVCSSRNPRKSWLTWPPCSRLPFLCPRPRFPYAKNVTFSVNGFSLSVPLFCFHSQACHKYSDARLARQDTYRHFRSDVAVMVSYLSILTEETLRHKATPTTDVTIHNQG